jgi:hypothetical protein
MIVSWIQLRALNRSSDFRRQIVAPVDAALKRKSPIPGKCPHEEVVQQMPAAFRRLQILAESAAGDDPKPISAYNSLIFMAF